jgi:hypothetical protein
MIVGKLDVTRFHRYEPLPFAGIIQIRFIGLEKFLSAENCTPSDVSFIEEKTVFVNSVVVSESSSRHF